MSAAFLVVVKHVIDSPRPYQIDSSVIQYATETSSGMPSGHAFLAMIIFGWLWFRHPKSLFLSVSAGVLIFMIGLSRIYLGLHYPSQVLVGWVLGLVALYVFWWVDKIYFRSRSSYVSKEKKRSR
jgi:membrane-associated phospholipid phosphatase